MASGSDITALNSTVATLRDDFDRSNTATRPAVVQAMGRCAFARTRGNHLPSLGRLHGDECAWCAYPVRELVAACEWAEWQQQLVVADLIVWRGAHGSSYVRSAKPAGDHYANPRWRDFWALPLKGRERRIAAVS